MHKPLRKFYSHKTLWETNIQNFMEALFTQAFVTHTKLYANSNNVWEVQQKLYANSTQGTTKSLQSSQEIV